jgi:cardiolipin synthase
MVVDESWVLLGSGNWDPRSLRLNFEFNVECYNETLGKTVTKIIDEKISRSRLITLKEMDSRSFPIRIRDGFARLLSPYL